MTEAFINRVASVAPPHDLHAPFVNFAEDMLERREAKLLFRRMAARAAINCRYSCLSYAEAAALYRLGQFPSTSQRMEIFEAKAPELAFDALDKLQLNGDERSRISHVIVTSCTGLYAPGLDFEIMDRLGLSTKVERTMIGFMGCYAAINALKLARHIVRSEPEAGVLIVNLELCTLHFQETQRLDQVLSFLIFGDGCSASLVTSNRRGFAMDRFHALLVPQTRDLITWRIRELGFDMLLSGKVPGEISKALKQYQRDFNDDGRVGLWAVHPGGRSVLDAVEQGLGLDGRKLTASRSVLAEFGNMSSATVMFVIERLLREAQSGQPGCAMSFGPGLTAETLFFHAA